MSLQACYLQTVHDGRIYTVKLYCDQNYPEKVGRVAWLLPVTVHRKTKHQSDVFCLSIHAGSTSQV